MLVVTKARNSAPTAWRVEVSVDGQNDWVEVGSVTDMKWKELGNVIESKNVTFDAQEIKGIRIWIDKANMTWGGYGMLEIEVYNH
jgi:hypothetical protein